MRNGNHINGNGGGVDEALLLAESIGDLRERLQKMEANITSHTAPVDAAAIVLSSALKGIEVLHDRVLAELGAVESSRQAVRDVAALSTALDSARKELADKVAGESGARSRDFAALDRRFAEAVAALQEDARRTVGNGVAALAKDLGAVREKLEAKPPTLNPLGEWKDGMTVDRLGVVSFLGSSWISLVDGNKGKPGKDKAKWMLLAARGVGTAGRDGTDGTGGGGFVAAPATATSSGTAGQMAYTAFHFYVCVAPNTWRRTALGAW